MKACKWLIATMVNVLGVVLYASCSSCQSTKDIHKEQSVKKYKSVSPKFNADSAYSYIEKQLSFGPRVPTTIQHIECGNWLSQKLSELGAQVYEQKANIFHFNGQDIELRNIIGSFNPEKERRVLLFAHWDTRPYADEESTKEEQYKPIPGADDGASGVGVLLEIARQLHIHPADIGIDIILFDMEDWGQASFDKDYIPGEWWCVGSRYWSETPHIDNYTAEYGILLDMVGAAGATFMREGYSNQYAQGVLKKVWSTASKLGYKNFFVNQKGGYITDDHVTIIENMGIPCVDIINLKDSDTGFVHYWHTHNDNIKNISKETLKAVGQTVMEVIYQEK